MKILHVTTHWQAGGSERNIRHHLACLADAGHDVALAVGAPASDDFTLPSNIAVHSVPSLQRRPALIKDLRALHELTKLLRRERYDLVHTHLSKAGLVGRVAARLSCTTTWHTVHGPQMLTNVAFRVAERLVLRLSSKIVFIGHDLLRSYADAFGELPASVVIRSPVEIDRFRAVPEIAHDPAGLHVLIATRLIKGKGLEDLVDLVAATPDEVNFTIAGDGPMLNQLESEIVAAGLSDRTRFVGYMPGIAGVMAESHVLVNLSPLEGCPQVIVQAVSAGRPVVTVRANGVGEMLEAGITGHVVEPGDISTVTTHLVELLRDQPTYAAMAAACRGADMSEWHPDSVALRQLELLECLA